MPKKPHSKKMISLATSATLTDEILNHTRKALAHAQEIASMPASFFKHSKSTKNYHKKCIHEIDFGIAASAALQPKGDQPKFLSPDLFEQTVCCGAVKEFLPSKYNFNYPLQTSTLQTDFLKSLPWSVNGKELAYAARLLVIQNKEKPSL